MQTDRQTDRQTHKRTYQPNISWFLAWNHTFLLIMHTAINNAYDHIYIQSHHKVPVRSYILVHDTILHDSAISYAIFSAFIIQSQQTHTRRHAQIGAHACGPCTNARAHSSSGSDVMHQSAEEAVVKLKHGQLAEARVRSILLSHRWFAALHSVRVLCLGSIQD
jgi:hypothetical protein